MCPGTQFTREKLKHDPHSNICAARCRARGAMRSVSYRVALQVCRQPCSTATARLPSALAMAALCLCLCRTRGFITPAFNPNKTALKWTYASLGHQLPHIINAKHLVAMLARLSSRSVKPQRNTEVHTHIPAPPPNTGKAME